jgi:hypothetical protein
MTTDERRKAFDNRKATFKWWLETEERRQQLREADAIMDSVFPKGTKARFRAAVAFTMAIICKATVDEALAASFEAGGLA